MFLFAVCFARASAAALSSIGTTTPSTTGSTSATSTLELSNASTELSTTPTVSTARDVSGAVSAGSTTPDVSLRASTVSLTRSASITATAASPAVAATNGTAQLPGEYNATDGLNDTDTAVARGDAEPDDAVDPVIVVKGKVAAMSADAADDGGINIVIAGDIKELQVAHADSIEVNGDFDGVRVDGVLKTLDTHGALEELTVTGPLDEIIATGPLDEITAKGRLEELRATGALDELSATGPLDELTAKGRLEELKANGRMVMVVPEKKAQPQRPKKMVRVDPDIVFSSDHFADLVDKVVAKRLTIQQEGLERQVKGVVDEFNMVMYRIEHNLSELMVDEFKMAMHRIERNVGELMRAQTISLASQFEQCFLPDFDLGN